MLTVHNTEAIRRIEAAIGYTFHDKRLLVQVLTRKTYLKIDPEAPDNEVLEFYGDTLMNYHVTNYFVAKYAHMLEDGLFFMRTVEQFTDLRSHYVCNRYLTERVKALGLARYLRAQNRDSELRRDGEKAYADIFESLVGAIYLDSYQNEALIRAFILRQLGIEPKRAPDEIESFDYDTLLDPPMEIPCDEPDDSLLPAEPVAEEAPVLPEMEEIVEELPFEETTETVDIPAEATAAAVEEIIPVEMSTAEEAAAPAPEISVEPAAPVVAVPVTNREKLAILCEQLGFDRPTYGETPPNAPNARPVAACTLKFRDARGKQVKISLNDSGKTLAEATEKAAAKMLTKVVKMATEADAKPAVKAEKPAKPAKFKAEKHPAAEVPAPVEVAPVETSPVEASPVEAGADVIELSLEEAPVVASLVAEIAPVETEAASVEEAPVETAPVEETPIEEAPAEVAPVTEAPTEEVSVEAPAETPAEAVPVEEAPAEAPVEAPADIPAETAPAAEDKPVKKAPAKKKAPTKKKTAPAKEKAVAAVAEESKPDAFKPEETNVKESKDDMDKPEEEKPTETAPAKKKAPSKKKTDTPTESAEPKKPRAPRKPKTPKEESAAAPKPDAE